MNRFRYYVADLGSGIIGGTDSPEIAASIATSQDYFVVDTFNNVWLREDGTEQDVEEMTRDTSEPLPDTRPDLHTIDVTQQQEDSK